MKPKLLLVGCNRIYFIVHPSIIHTTQIYPQREAVTGALQQNTQQKLPVHTTVGNVFQSCINKHKKSTKYTNMHKHTDAIMYN